MTDFETYNHSEQTDNQLEERINLLTNNLETIPYRGKRLDDIRHEIACIAFEQLYRKGELWRLGVKENDMLNKRPPSV